MKKIHGISCMLVLVACTWLGCKKENAKDYNALVTNRVWTGEFTAKTNGIAQPFSIEFQEGGSLVWREFSGEYKGGWKINGQQLAMRINNTDSIQATIGDDNTMMAIKNPPGGRNILNGGLNNETAVVLNNSSWKLKNLDYTLEFSTRYITYQFVTDIYSQSGASIRWPAQNSGKPTSDFLVLMPGGKSLKGVEQKINNTLIRVEFIRQ